MVGGRHAEVAAQDVQAQVDARGGARRGQHAALVDEEHVLVHAYARVLRGELPGVVPVRGGAFAVEQAGGGERERPGRDRGQPYAAGVRGQQRVDHGRRRVLPVREAVAGDEDDIGPVERAEAVGDVVRQAVAASDQAGRGTADAYLVRHARSGC